MGASTAAAVAGIASAAVSMGTSIYGATQSGDAASSANNAIQGGVASANDTQRYMYDQMRSDLNLYRFAGNNALDQYMQNLGTPAEGTEMFNTYKNYVNSGFKGVEDPSVQYVQDQASNAVQKSAAAKGGLLSGGAEKALQKNAANIASTYWQNAFNNYLNQGNAYKNLYNTYETSHNNYLQQLLSAAQMGQNSATATGSAGLTAGNALANNALLSAVSNANNAVSQGNAASNVASSTGSGIGSILSQLGGMNWGNILGNGRTSSYYDPGIGETMITSGNVSTFS